MKLTPDLKCVRTAAGLNLYRNGSTAVLIQPGPDARLVLREVAELEAGALPFVPLESTPPASVAEAVRDRCRELPNGELPGEDETGPVTPTEKPATEAVDLNRVICGYNDSKLTRFVAAIERERDALRAQIAEATRDLLEAKAQNARDLGSLHALREGARLTQGLLRDGDADLARVTAALERIAAGICSCSNACLETRAVAAAALAPSPAEAVKAEAKCGVCRGCCGPYCQCSRCHPSLITAATVCPRCSVSGAPCACEEKEDTR